MKSYLTLFTLACFFFLGAQNSHAAELRNFLRANGTISLDYQNVQSEDSAKKNVATLDARIIVSDDDAFCSITFIKSKDVFSCTSDLSYGNTYAGDKETSLYLSSIKFSEILVSEFNIDDIITSTNGGVSFFFRALPTVHTSKVQLHTKNSWESYHLTFTLYTELKQF